MIDGPDTRGVPAAAAAPAAGPASPCGPLALDWSAWDAYGAGDAYAQLPAHGEGWGKASAACIGSRACQRDAGGVMCPSYRATLDTAHSTGHRAATLKAALDGELQGLDDPRLAEAMDLCVSCKGCKRDCPNGVDMALLRTEWLAQRWQHQAPPWRDRLFARGPELAHRLRRWPGLRLLLDLAPRVWPAATAWLLARQGLAPQRSLPRLAARTALQDWPTAPASTEGAPSGRPVVLWVDSFTNHLDPQIARDAAAVLQAAGCQVQVLQPPPGEAPWCCGRTAFSGGMIDAARATAQRTLAALAPHIERGEPIIGLEPSCLLMFRDEYTVMGLGPQAQALARQAWLLEEFLAREIDAKRLSPPAWQPLSRKVHVHGHCHAKAFGALKPLRKVLGWIPQLQVEMIDASCCGMAGSFGFEAEHHAMSMRMAELKLLPAVRAAAEDDWVLANGTSCRHQIHDGAGRRSLHLAQVLRAALPVGA